MGQAKGSAVQFLLDFETTYGSDPGAAAAFNMPFNTETLTADRNITDPNTIRSHRNPVMPIHGNKNVSGNVVVPVDLINIGLWLRALLGANGYSVAGAEAPYTHTFKIGSAIESLVGEVGFTDIGRYHKYNGVKIDKMGIGVGGDGELLATLEMIGASETPAAAAYDANPTSLVFTRFNQMHATMEEGGGSIGYLKTFNLNINNRLDPDSYVIAGGGIRGALPEGVVVVSGSLSALFQDDVLLGKARAGTETSLSLILTNGAYSLTFALPEVQYKLKSPVVNGPGGVYVELDYQAYYEDNADETALKATLVNTYEDYTP